MERETYPPLPASGEKSGLASARPDEGRSTHAAAREPLPGTRSAAVAGCSTSPGERGDGSVTVAAAQIACVPGDIAANMALHLTAIADARARGVDLLVFPELSLTDYETAPDAGRLARSSGCSELRTLAEASRGLTVVVGFIEANPAGLPFNACAVMADGGVRHVHRKLNLPTYGGLVEGDHYAAGSELDLCRTPLGRSACLICADTWNPVIPWLAALDDAEALIVPVASSRGSVSADFDNRDGWRVNLRHTALTYGVPIVMANHSGARGGLDFRGGSAIVDAFGRVLAEGGEEPDFVVATLAAGDGAIARSRLPTIRDASPAMVRSQLERMLARETGGMPLRA